MSDEQVDTGSAKRADDLSIRQEMDLEPSTMCDRRTAYEQARQQTAATAAG